MAKVTFDMSMSLDGFITGPGDGVDQPLGEGGDRLHEWIYGLASWRARHGLPGGESSRDAEVAEEAFANTGAVVMGRRMFDHGEGPWGDDPPFHMPVFVVTHEQRDPVVKGGGTSFAFVTGGPQRAVERARAAARGKDVSVAGGASVVQQLLNAGLIDEFQLHVVPVLMGGGVRLLDGLGRSELERLRVIDSPDVTHLKFRVGGA